MTRLKKNKVKILDDTAECHADQAVCAPPPQLIRTRRRRLCLPLVDETSAPPAPPVGIQRVRHSTTMLKSFSDTVKSFHQAIEKRKASQNENQSFTDSSSSTADKRSSRLSFSAKQTPKAPGKSLRELLAQTSLVDLGKQLTSAQLND